MEGESKSDKKEHNTVSLCASVCSNTGVCAIWGADGIQEKL